MASSWSSTRRGSPLSLKCAGYQFVFRIMKGMSRFRKPTAAKLKQAMEGGIGKLGKPLKSVTIEDIDLGGIPAVRFSPPAPREDALLFYIHGGGYISCSARLYGVLISKLATTLGMTVYAPDYRLAPEHPMPAALEDCLAAYAALPESEVFIGGDSAGGGLTLSTLQALRDAGSKLPAAAFTISAYADQTGSGETYRTRARADPMMTIPQMEVLAAAACGDIERDDARVSPVFGDFTGLPPLLMLVGDREILQSDSTRSVDKATSQGVPATLHVAPKMHHDWPMFPIKEAKSALDLIADHLAA